MRERVIHREREREAVTLGSVGGNRAGILHRLRGTMGGRGDRDPSRVPPYGWDRGEWVVVSSRRRKVVE